MPGRGLLGLCQPQQLPAGLEESLLGTAVGDAGAGIDRRFVAERSCRDRLDPRAAVYYPRRPLTTAVGAEVAELEPAELLAVTTARSVEPTSLAVAV
jgi:hypothetical protein